MQTLEALKAKIAQLTKKAQAMESKSLQRVLQLMQKLGVTVEDLIRQRGSKPRTKKSSVGRPKYRDPATGRTWTGHGRAPDWIKSAANREPFLIGKDSATASARSGARKAIKKSSSGATGKHGRKSAVKAAKVAKPDRAAAKRNGKASAVSSA